jgi:hypothetical protein
MKRKNSYSIISFIDPAVLNIITLPGEPKGATSAAGLLQRRGLVPMVTYKIDKEYMKTRR